MSAGHEHAETFAGMNAAYQRRLMLVTAINIAMFFVEMIAGQFAGSQALKADALDFFADGITYAVSFWAIGRPVALRSMAALAKGGSLVLMGVWVAATTLYHFFVEGIPEAETMGGIGVLALAANVFTVVLLLPYKDGDANVRSVWLCSRNDAIGNIAVMIAAALVYVFGNRTPDLVVAGVMAALFLTSATQILRQALAEWEHERMHASAGGHSHGEAGLHEHGDGEPPHSGNASPARLAAARPAAGHAVRGNDGTGS
jgi:Co/Zn/Cd efflux system component